MRVKIMFAIAVACLALVAASLRVRAEAAHDARAGESRFNDAARANASQRRGKPRGRARRRKIVREKLGGVAEGLWGGAHVRLNVRAGGAELEFDCARGEISAPFETDAEGRFDLPGTFTREGGPIRVGITPPARPARYSGRVEGRTMTLGLKLTGTDQTLDTYTLSRGSEGRLWKCR